MSDGVDRPRERLTRLEGGGDIEDDDLVDPLDVVSPRELGGVAGVPKLLKLHALDHLPVAHVHAGDDSLGQHARQTVEEVPKDLQSGVAGFLRMKLHPEDAIALDDRRKRLRMRRRRHAVGGHRRRVGVREIDVRARRELAKQSAAQGPASLRLERVPADMRDLEALLRISTKPRHPSRQDGEALTSGASSLPSKSHCMPRQMPSRGVPPATAFAIASRQAPSSAAVAAKLPTPGTIRPDALAHSSGDCGVPELGAERRERLAHRREVARAVVDERNHSSPFVLGSIFASRASLAHATRKARANALNTASTW